MDDDEFLLLCLEKTRRCSVNWFDLGLMLKVKKHILNEIKEDNPGKVGTCRREMLDAWLKSDPADPEAQLDAALNEFRKTTHNSVKGKKIAHIIMYTKIRNYAFISIDNHNAECLSLNDDVQVKILELKREFTDISMKAREHLKAKYSDAKEAAWWLNETLGGTLNEPLVVKGSVSDYAQLGEQLQNKWRFANPDFLEQLIQEIEDTGLIEQMKIYRKKFDQFCSSFPITKDTTNNEVFFEDYDPSQPCLVLIIEWDTNFRAIEVFLEDVFGIYKQYLRVHKIKSGDIKKVTLQFPQSMEPQLEERIKRNVNKYANIQVEQAEAPETQSSGSHEKEQTTTETSIKKTRTQPSLEVCTKRDFKIPLRKVCIAVDEKEMQVTQMQLYQETQPGNAVGKTKKRRYQKKKGKKKNSSERKDHLRIMLDKYHITGANGENPKAQ